MDHKGVRMAQVVFETTIFAVRYLDGAEFATAGKSPIRDP
jgi:hypothetical protein